MATSSADAPPARTLARATVAVVMGGASSEREVSRITGAAVVDALRSPRGPADRRGPAGVLPVELLPDGSWLVEERAHDPTSALAELRDSVDVFFVALHGGDGEDGTLQGLFESLAHAYTGSGVRASSVCMDKLLSRQALAASGFRTPATHLVRAADWARDPAAVRAAVDALASPHGWVTKPRCGGSSVGVSVVRETSELGLGLELALAEEGEVLVEPYVPGVEAACGVLDELGRAPQALPVVEIRPHTGRFFDYEEKYSEHGAEELCPPRSIPAETCERLRALAIDAHRALGCAGYSRADFIVPEGGGQPVLLELNTLPGLTPRSLVPKAAAQAGVDYRTLCLRLAADGLARGVRRGAAAGT